MSRALMEGASCEKPLITTNVPGCKELVDDLGSGYLCEPRSTKALAEAFDKFCLLSKKELETMGKKSRELILKNFDIEIVKDFYRRKG